MRLTVGSIETFSWRSENYLTFNWTFLPDSSTPTLRFTSRYPVLSTSSYVPPVEATRPAPRRKNWDTLTENILSSEKEKTTDEDANVGGDATLNSFFQKVRVRPSGPR
jgi:hypothetical protein